MSNQITAFASAARAEATYNADISAPESEGYKGVWLCVDITAESGVATLDVKLQRFDQVSGKYVDMPGAAIAQQSATGTVELTVYPGIAETTNVSVSDHVTDRLRVVATVGGTSVTMTFTVAGHWLK